jgi:hypothetical protein
LGREGDVMPVNQPPMPAHLGWNPGPVLDGWEAQRHVVQVLAPSKVLL